MTDKGFVSMEQHVCPVCSAVHDTGTILFDQRLGKSMGSHTTTGYGLCEACQEKKDEGFIALVEVVGKGGDRTGNYVHVREGAWGSIFNIPVPEEKICFVEPAVVTILRGLQKET